MTIFNYHSLNAYVADTNGSRGSQKDLIGAQDASPRIGMCRELDRIR